MSAAVEYDLPPIPTIVSASEYLANRSAYELRQAESLIECAEGHEALAAEAREAAAELRRHSRYLADMAAAVNNIAWQPPAEEENP